MSGGIRFYLEMLDTPKLAQHCHKLKAEIDELAELINIGKASPIHKRELMAELKLAKSILKNRQLRLFE